MGLDAVKILKNKFVKIIAGPILFLAALVAVLCVTELFWRIFVLPEHVINIFTPDKEIGWKLMPCKNMLQRGDLVLTPTNNKQQTTNNKQTLHNWCRVNINSTNFRGPEIPPDADKRFRVVCIGDSSTFGLGEDEQFIYSTVLENILSTKRPSVVFNLGVPGYTSTQGLLRLRKMIGKLKPNAIIISFGINDYANIKYRRFLLGDGDLTDEDVFRYRKRDGLGNDLFFGFAKTIYPILRRSALFEWILLKRPLDFSQKSSVPKDVYSRNLLEIAGEADKRGSIKVFLSACMGYCPYDDVLKQAAAAANVPLFPFSSIVKADGKKYFYDPKYAQERKIMEDRFGIETFAANEDLLLTNDFCHPNPIGHKVIAENLAEIIER